ncbi:minor capsid protein [Vagococcus salmoninarum]|uniref:minor capsid protein n=1 Tax=Vagococcus salmoninarum TaxID=2739 RepID=UPI003F9950B3
MTSYLKKIQDDIRAFYQRYADKENLTYQEAQKAVSQFDVTSFESKAKEYVENKDFSSKANYQLRLYNTKMKISRLELLCNDIQLEIAKMYDSTSKIMGKSLEEVYEMELKRQAGILGLSVNDLRKASDAFLRANHRGVTFADFWGKDLSKLYNEIDTALESALMNGEHPYKLVGKMKDKFGTYQYQAERLLITETTYTQTRLQLASFKEAGFTRFRFVAESGACKECSNYQGQVFNIDEWLNAPTPPLHPYCRCSLVPVD